jgi:bifunctional pyridoxal-dependent enzyme with beta-cystathionase and maltose regulon repressor activities
MRITEEYINQNIPILKFHKPQGTYLAWIDFGAWMDNIDAKTNAEKGY